MALLLLLCALVLLIVAPGYLLLPLLRLDQSWTPLERACVAFTLGLAVLSLLAWAYYGLGLSLEAMTYTLAAVGGLGLLLAAERASRLSVRLPDGRGLLESRGPDAGVIAFAISCAGLAAWAGPWFSSTADSFWHLAALRSLQETGRTLVDHNIYLNGHEGIDPLGSTWQSALASTAVLTGTGPVSLWTAAIPLSAAVLVVSFYLFAAAVLRNRAAALLGTVAQFVLFQSLDFRLAAQPNNLSFAAMWVVLALLIRSRDRLSVPVAALLAFLGAMLASLHFFTFEAFLLLAGGYLVVGWAVSRWRRSGEDYRPAVAVVVAAAAMGAGIFFARAAGTDLLTSQWQEPSWEEADYATLGSIGDGIWSSLSLPGRALGDSPPFSWLSSLHLLEPSLVFVSPLHLISYLAALGLLIGALRGRRSAQFLAPAALAVPLLALNPLVVSLTFERVTDIPIRRLPSIAPLALLLVAAGYQVAEELPAWWRRLREQRRSMAFAGPAVVAVVAVLAAVAVPLRAVDTLRSTYFDLSDKLSVASSRRDRLDPDEGVFRYLSDNAGNDAMLLSDQNWSYRVAGLTGQKVIYVKQPHWPGNVPAEENRSRRHVLQVVFPGPIDLPDFYDILLVWDVDFVLIDRAAWPDWHLRESRYGILKAAFEEGDVVLYAVDRSPENLATAVALSRLPARHRTAAEDSGCSAAGPDESWLVRCGVYGFNVDSTFRKVGGIDRMSRSAVRSHVRRQEAMQLVGDLYEQAVGSPPPGCSLPTFDGDTLWTLRCGKYGFTVEDVRRRVGGLDPGSRALLRRVSEEAAQ